MNIQELKEIVETGRVPDDFMIWQITDESSMIIVNQYVDKICESKHLKRKSIDKIIDIPDESFIKDINLYIINVDKWESDDTHNNCIIICKSTKKDSIKIPKLEDWAVIDYLKPQLDGLDDELDDLVPLYNGNYQLLLNDIDKISIFGTGNQKFILKELQDDGSLDHLTKLNIWDLSNALIKKDIRVVADVLEHIEYIDVEPIGLLKVVWKNFKNISNIQLNPRCTASDVNMSDKQFFVVKKYNCGYYTRDQLVKIMDMITNLEYSFKYEGLDMSDMIDYIIVKVLGA